MGENRQFLNMTLKSLESFRKSYDECVASDMKESCQRVASDMKESCQRVASDMKKSGQRVASDMKKSSQRVASDIQELGQNIEMAVNRDQWRNGIHGNHQTPCKHGKTDVKTKINDDEMMSNGYRIK